MHLHFQLLIASNQKDPSLAFSRSVRIICVYVQHVSFINYFRTRFNTPYEVSDISVASWDLTR